ncbi:ribosomal L27 protein-domain-containing protein [Pelagophyceae sp. CCMP2097]|nr:ribosomal L27 protein-domain-containing protein [Pelagophyceae sp. CCMP2097]
MFGLGRASSLLRHAARSTVEVAKRFATKKAGGAVRNGRSAKGQHMGVKKFSGAHVIPGNIIIRQRGSRFYAGENVMTGRDWTLFAVQAGTIIFTETGRRVGAKQWWKFRQYVNVTPYSAKHHPWRLGLCAWPEKGSTFLLSGHHDHYLQDPMLLKTAPEPDHGTPSHATLNARLALAAAATTPEEVSAALRGLTLIAEPETQKQAGLLLHSDAVAQAAPTKAS